MRDSGNRRCLLCMHHFSIETMDAAKKERSSIELTTVRLSTPLLVYHEET
jgi:hypothetical protein